MDSSSLDNYAAILCRTGDDLLSIVKIGDIINFDSIWFEGKEFWPGPHQQEKKLKLAIWWDKEEMTTGTVVFLGSKEEAKIQFDRLVAPPKDLVNSAKLEHQVADLMTQVSVLQLEVASLRQIARDYESIRKEMQEKAECCKFIGQYGTRVGYNQLNIALAAFSDLDGFKSLVGSCFGADFDDNKKKAHLNYENFPEKSQLWELMAYFCHCKLMVEENPTLPYGTAFPDFPPSELLSGKRQMLINDDGNEFDLSSGSLSRKMISSKNGNDNKRKSKKIITPLAERTQHLCISYAKSFTNYYQSLQNGEDLKEKKRLKERERRAKKKLELQNLLNQQNGLQSENVFRSNTNTIDNED